MSLEHSGFVYLTCGICSELLASSGIPALDKLLVDGYPDRSTILVVGPPGIGKEALGYWFTQSGLTQGDFCLYITRLSVREVLLL